MQKLAFILALVLVLGLSACGGESAPSGGEGEAAGPGDAASGETLFNQSLIGSQAGCLSCHSLEPGVNMVGPSLATIGADAGSRVSGVSAEDYLRESIVAPDAHVVAGFGAGIMPRVYGDELTAEQVSDLVAFLLTLK